MTRDGRAFTWGNNVFGELGLGDKTNRSVPTGAQGLPARVLKAALGLNCSVLLLDSGRVVAFGSNNYGRCGLAKSSNHRQLVPALVGGALATQRVVHVAAGGYHVVGRALSCGFHDTTSY